ncbi:hypothetical protein BDA96_10G155200 [Sorghum bicolor]|uniref:Uncharacterized protein n=2 Tax=Sorghum bicolor TaxID=4558 RepID=A0A921Q1X0_SORBI|nr:hypothetical protein BDA96_10G155200 [Sorghum bicolor]OQU76283.1 hypothetical protein SORBI_3010G124850 [Sorghum bicolor]
MLISIGCVHQWQKYVRTAMKSQFQSLDMVVLRVLVDPMPPYFDHATFAMEPKVAPRVPDAQSADNEVCVAIVVGDGSGSHDVMVEPPQEIPLTQNHLSKCLFHIVPLSINPSGHLLMSFFPYNLAYAARDITNNLDVPHGDGFCAYNSVDSESYQIAMAANSNDDHVGNMP